MNQPNKSFLLSPTTCPDCLGTPGLAGEAGCICEPPERLIHYEIYELIDVPCPRGGTRQVARHFEWGYSTEAELERIREERIIPHPELHLIVNYPNRGEKPRWEGTLEQWIGRRR